MSVVRNLRRDYGDFVVDVPEWEILDRGVTALSGPSGSGKTSIMRLLLGLDDADPGFSWTWEGNEDLARLPTPQRRIGPVFQTYELFPHMTARQNAQFAADARRVPRDESEARLASIARILGIEGILDRKAAVLSGGEKQRVALARALMGRPRILFLDESFSSLDADARAGARELVRAALESEGIPALLVTHDRADIDALAARVTAIRDGRIVSDARARGL